MPACALSFEPAEAFFSLATRYCRVTGIALKELVGNGARNDRTALRDFPISASRLEAHMRAKFDRRNLFTEHSACQYFGTTIDEPFRSAEIESSVDKVGALLHSSLGTMWGHLRFCSQCAAREFEFRRYSWWHRDHQLPLSSVCLVHGCPLHNVSLGNLGMWLPHELLYDGTANFEEGPATTQDFALAVARFEHCLANENRQDIVSALLQEIKMSLTNFSHDEFDREKCAFSRVRRVVNRLQVKGITEPFNDWERVRVAICAVLRGSGYCDPVVAALLILAFNFSYLIHWGFGTKTSQGAD